MGTKITNPAGREGKPFTLAPHSFDDALRKILAAKPEPREPAKVKPQRTPSQRKTLKRGVPKG
jgi:hypothetical protein